MRDDVTNIPRRGTSIVSVQELETQLQRKDILLEQTSATTCFCFLKDNFLDSFSSRPKRVPLAGILRLNWVRFQSLLVV